MTIHNKTMCVCAVFPPSCLLLCIILVVYYISFSPFSSSLIVSPCIALQTTPLGFSLPYVLCKQTRLDNCSLSYQKNEEELQFLHHVQRTENTRYTGIVFYSALQRRRHHIRDYKLSTPRSCMQKTALVLRDVGCTHSYTNVNGVLCLVSRNHTRIKQEQNKMSQSPKTTPDRCT